MRVIIGFFASLLLLFGIWAITLSIDHYRMTMASGSWPAVEGEVVLSQIREEINYGTLSRKKSPEIRYEYTVDGNRYSSRTIKFGVQPSHEIVSRYPENHKIKVYYNPDNPKQAVLIPGRSLAGVYSISLYNCKQLTDEAIKSLAGVHTIDLSYCEQLTDKAIKSLNASVVYGREIINKKN